MRNSRTVVRLSILLPCELALSQAVFLATSGQSCSLPLHAYFHGREGPLLHPHSRSDSPPAPIPLSNPSEY